MNRRRPEWLDENAAAKYLGFHPRVLREYVKKGKLNIAYTNINGRKFKYEKGDIDKLLLDNSTYIK
jgi:hypothetical protein